MPLPTLIVELNNDKPYHQQFGYHCEMQHFRPFACRCTVFRGKDLVNHRKITARGIACVYLGTGVAFGRKCFLAYSPAINRVFATVDCQCDETYYPYRHPGHRRDYGMHDAR